MNGAKAAVSQVRNAVGGIADFGISLQRQGNGIEAKIPSPEIINKACPGLSRQIDRPALQHKSGHVPLLIQHHTGAIQLPSEFFAQANDLIGDDQIKIGTGPQSAQQGIADSTTNQGRAWWQQRWIKRPSLRCQPFQQLPMPCLLRDSGLQNGGPGVGGRDVHLR